MNEYSNDTIIDFITGKTMPNVGAELNRQSIERFLVNEKGFEKHDIEVDVEIIVTISDTAYRSRLDLVICVDGTRFIAIKCVAGSPGSWEREVLSAARLLDTYQIPFSIVSDGETAIILDTVTGKTIGQGLDAIPSKSQLIETKNNIRLLELKPDRREREKLIFRSYDMMNVNRVIV